VANDKLPEQFSEYLRKLGKKGGKRRLETMTPEERSAVAKKGAAKSAEVREAKAAKKKSGAKRKPPEKGN
jgi:hypothetical protein